MVKQIHNVDDDNNNNRSINNKLNKMRENHSLFIHWHSCDIGIDDIYNDDAFILPYIAHLKIKQKIRIKPNTKCKWQQTIFGIWRKCANHCK